MGVGPADDVTTQGTLSSWRRAIPCRIKKGGEGIPLQNQKGGAGPAPALAPVGRYPLLCCLRHASMRSRRGAAHAVATIDTGFLSSQERFSILSNVTCSLRMRERFAPPASVKVQL